MVEINVEKWYNLYKGWIYKMKIISDIRLYKSSVKNEFGSFITESFGGKKLNAIIKRIVMKLRENNFSFGNYDHLYLNFTICDITEEIELSNNIDNYHPWYRYCNVKINENLFGSLDNDESIFLIINHVEKVLCLFVSEIFDLDKIKSCISQALEQKENMLMKYKEKETNKGKVIIYLRFLDTCEYFPLLRLFDKTGVLLIEEDLPKTLTLDYIGELLIKKESIIIKPKQNAYSKCLDDILINY